MRARACLDLIRNVAMRLKDAELRRIRTA